MNIFFETHRHIEHIVFDVFFYKNYVFYVSMCFKKNIHVFLSVLSLFSSAKKGKFTYYFFNQSRVAAKTRSRLAALTLTKRKEDPSVKKRYRHSIWSFVAKLSDSNHQVA